MLFDPRQDDAVIIAEGAHLSDLDANETAVLPRQTRDLLVGALRSSPTRPLQGQHRTGPHVSCPLLSLSTPVTHESGPQVFNL